MSANRFPKELQDDLTFIKNQVGVYYRAIKIYKDDLENRLNRSQKFLIFVSSAMALAEFARATFDLNHWGFQVSSVLVNAFIAGFIAYMKFNRYVERIKAAEAGQAKVEFLGEEFNKASIITVELWTVLNDMFAAATKEFEGLMEPSQQEKAAKAALKSHLKQLGRNNQLKHILADDTHGLSKKEKKQKANREAELPAPLAITDVARGEAQKSTHHDRSHTWSNVFSKFRGAGRQSPKKLKTENSTLSNVSSTPSGADVGTVEIRILSDLQQEKQFANNKKRKT
jgi:hypothetical protein